MKPTESTLQTPKFTREGPANTSSLQQQFPSFLSPIQPKNSGLQKKIVSPEFISSSSSSSAQVTPRGIPPSLHSPPAKFQSPSTSINESSLMNDSILNPVLRTKTNKQDSFVEKTPFPLTSPKEKSKDTKMILQYQRMASQPIENSSDLSQSLVQPSNTSPTQEEVENTKRLSLQLSQMSIEDTFPAPPRTCSSSDISMMDSMNDEARASNTQKRAEISKTPLPKNKTMKCSDSSEDGLLHLTYKGKFHISSSSSDSSEPKILPAEPAPAQSSVSLQTPQKIKDKIQFFNNLSKPKVPPYEIKKEKEEIIDLRSSSSSNSIISLLSSDSDLEQDLREKEPPEPLLAEYPIHHSPSLSSSSSGSSASSTVYHFHTYSSSSSHSTYNVLLDSPSKKHMTVDDPLFLDDASVMSAKTRQLCTSQSFDLFNERVFENKLPQIPIQWSKKLKMTAGRAHLITEGKARSCSIELSESICATALEVRTTLLHEMCHCICFLLSGEKHNHDKTFEMWGKRASAQFPKYKVTTKHNFKIHKKYRWQCTNPDCKNIVGFPTNCVNVNKHVCSLSELLITNRYVESAMESSSFWESSRGMAPPLFQRKNRITIDSTGKSIRKFQIVCLRMEERIRT